MQIAQLLRAKVCESSVHDPIPCEVLCFRKLAKSTFIIRGLPFVSSRECHVTTSLVGLPSNVGIFGLVSGRKTRFHQPGSGNGLWLQHSCEGILFDRFIVRDNLRHDVEAPLYVSFEDDFLVTVHEPHRLIIEDSNAVQLGTYFSTREKTDT